MTYRTAGCGELRAGRVGEAVTLSGWVARRRDHGGLIFVDLRDRTGLVQVVIDPADAPEAHAVAHDLRVEAVVRVVGDVVARSLETVNPRLDTGEVEVAARELAVLGPADPLPFQLDDENVDETLRIRHRALDLRRPVMTERQRVRAQVARIMRRHLEDRGFWEIETPILGKSTPEGARDFLVPARLRHGSFYALPQSPQLYKQLTQLAGFERYYQIARCFRDEAQRADRQLEFTQLDVEMSFVTQDDVMELMEGLYAELWRELLGVELELPLRRLTHAEAMLRYGSDRPDLRFGLEIADVTELVRGSEFSVFRGAAEGGGVVRALACPGGASLARRELDELAAFAKEWGGKGLAYLLLEESGEVRSPIAKFLSQAELDGLRAATGAGAGDAIFIAADERPVVERVLGALRPHLAQRFELVPDGAWAFTWVVDFPAYHFDPDERRWVAEHHVFTAPRPEHEALLESDPGAVLSQAYDLVINGHEAGGGSIRINRPELQERALAVVGITADEAEARFGFLLRALRFGAPPHGGIAMGLDRCIMLVAGTDNIRDVIAFPKVAGGIDPLTDAPTPVDRPQLDELGLALKAPPVRSGPGDPEAAGSDPGGNDAS